MFYFGQAWNSVRWSVDPTSRALLLPPHTPTPHPLSGLTSTSSIKYTLASSSYSQATLNPFSPIYFLSVSQLLFPTFSIKVRANQMLNFWNFIFPPPESFPPLAMIIQFLAKRLLRVMTTDHKRGELHFFPMTILISTQDVRAFSGS